MHVRLTVLSVALAFAAPAGAVLIGTSSVQTEVTSASDSLNRIQQIFNVTVPAELHDSIAHTLPVRGVPVTTATADAVVDWTAGQLRTSARATLSNPCLVNNLLVCTGGTGTVKARAYASGRVTASDLQFLGLDLNSPFLTSANLDLSGSVLRSSLILEGDTQSYYDSSLIPDSKLHFRYQLSQAQPQINPDRPAAPPIDVGVTLASGSIDINAHYDGTLSFTTSGFVSAPSNWSNGSHLLTTTSFTVYPNRPVSMFLAAELDSGEQYSVHEFADVAAALLFGSTFGLPSGVAVFNDLPQGIAVSSTDFAITGNRFGQPVPLPLPSALLVVACAMLTRRRGDTGSATRTA